LAVGLTLEQVAEDFQNPPRAVAETQDPQANINFSKQQNKMANHKSSLKRIRQTKARTLHNRYYAKTMRNAVRKLRAMTDKEEALKQYPAVQKIIDKLAKMGVIHANKAANIKSGVVKHINSL
jgi:small subunit ribosomal protein S20